METETIETKKCNNCLKRITIEKIGCPHCRNDDFICDGKAIMRTIPKKFILEELIESIAALFNQH